MKIGEYRLFARPRSRPIVIVHAVTNVDQIHRRRPKGVIYIKKTFIQSQAHVYKHKVHVTMCIYYQIADYRRIQYTGTAHL